MEINFDIQRFGSGRFDADIWSTYKSSHIDHKTTKEIFSTHKADNDFMPTANMIRESCDSEDNPNSTPIIIACDVSGSMSPILDRVIRTELPELITQIYDRKPVTDPHLMFMGVGDVEAGDNYPLQVTQFEADIRIAEQLQKIYLEEGGGGNDHESYLLPLWFAKHHTKVDSFLKRGKKGYIFTMGDEEPQTELSKKMIQEAIPNEVVQFDNISADDLITDVSKEWNIFHLVLEEGHYFRRWGGKECANKWKELYGQKALFVSDIKKISEIITSTIQIIEGESKDKVLKSWDNSTALVVRHAIQNLANANNTELVEF